MKICESSTTRISEIEKVAMNAYSLNINRSLLYKFHESEEKMMRSLLIDDLDI